MTRITNVYFTTDAKLYINFQGRDSTGSVSVSGDFYEAILHVLAAALTHSLNNQQTVETDEVMDATRKPHPQYDMFGSIPNA